MPATTGFTASRWLGFGAIDTHMWPARDSVVPPAWYFTSPMKPRSSRSICTAIGSLNSARICVYGFSRMCASTFSRPRCAMPSIMWRVPVPAAPIMISSRIGSSMSSPSIENRVLPVKVRCRKRSNTST